MSIVGTVWPPIGPSPINEGGGQDNGLVTAIAVNPNNPNIIYLGTGRGGVWRSDDGGATLDRRCSIGRPRSASASPAASRSTRTTPTPIYVGTSGRVVAPAAGRALQVDRRRRQLGAPRLGLTRRATSATRAQFIDPVDQRHHRRSGRQQHGLSRLDQRHVPLDRRRPELDAGHRAFRRRRARWCSTCRRRPARGSCTPASSGRGVFRSTDGGQNVDADAERSHARRAGSARAGQHRQGRSSHSPRRPRRRIRPACRSSMSRWPGTGGAPDPVGFFVSTDQGSHVDAAERRPGMPGEHPRRLQLPHGGRSGLTGRRGQRHRLLRHRRSIPLAPTPGRTSPGSAVLHADTHAWTFVPQPAAAIDRLLRQRRRHFRSTDGGALDGAQQGRPADGPFLQHRHASRTRPPSVTLGALQDNEIQTTKGAAGPAWNATSAATAGTSPTTAACRAGLLRRAGSGRPPCTRDVSLHRRRRDVPGTRSLPWGDRPSDAGCYPRADRDRPSAGGIRLRQRQPEPVAEPGRRRTWRIIAASAAPATSMSRRPTATMSSSRSGNKVCVSTNALAATVGPPTGVTFTDITRDLP